MPKIFINGAKLYYELYGYGYPLVLIAGYGGGVASSMPIVGELSKHFQVLIFDNRGVGQTEDDGGELSAQLMAKDVIALCDALVLKFPHIVGRSMGGTVAQTIAANYPERVGKIAILVSSAKWRRAMLNHFIIQVKMQEENINLDLRDEVNLAWLAGEKLLKNPEQVLSIKQTWASNAHNQSLADQKRQYKVLEDFDGAKQLNRIKAPTIIIYGNQDIIALPSESKFLAEKIPNSKLVEFNCGHLILDEQAQKLVKELLAFLWVK